MPIPLATYRLQFQPDFGFRQAARIVPYLAALGISHIYASPISRARKGSPHGYDGVDPNALNPELGSPDDWRHLVERLREHRIGWLQDIVPNHMAYDADNSMLADLLENGSASPFHDFFDICWNHPAKELRGKVAAPFLGRRYASALENGEIRLSYDADGFAATTGHLRFPIRIETYLSILETAGGSIKTELGESHPDYERWIDTLDNLESLVLQTHVQKRQDQVRGIKQALWDLYGGNPVIRARIADTLDALNGTPGRIQSYQGLDRLLCQQKFRLCYWKVANEEINFRRFFDINGLIALRQDRQAVFDHTHAMLFDLAAEGIVGGVRVDHVDGLADPAGYLRRLRRHLSDRATIVVEKILAPEESLPTDWPVQGTTGYDFSFWLNAVFVQRRNETAFDRIYTRFSGETDGFEEVVVAAKKEILLSRLAGDLDNLARRFKTVSSSRRFADNLPFEHIKQALAEVLAHFPVYRTYIESGPVRKADRDAVDGATALAVRRRPNLKDGIEFVRGLLLADPSLCPEGRNREATHAYRLAVRSFQQLSAALMAKGFEDTAFYRYHRLVSLNDVGGEPGRFGCSIDDFHRALQRRAARWPHAMNGSATHDSKRGEDVRARLNVLSEIPDEWEAFLETCHELMRGFRKQSRSGPVPDRKTEILLVQTLIGIWPPDGAPTPRWVARVQEYMLKAAREAGERTSWIEPCEFFEKVLAEFVESLLDPFSGNAVLPVLSSFCQRVSFFGLLNSLSQCLVKITAPGVPDFYQGTERLQLTLVDPDNRQPVRFDERSQQLESIRGDGTDPLRQVAQLLDRRDEGTLKLFTIARALEIRSRLKRVFQAGRYLPLTVGGPFSRHVLAYAREAGGSWCVVAVPRFVTALVETGLDPLGEAVWGATAVELPGDAPRSWHNPFTRQELQGDGRIAAADAFGHFPVALLVGEKSP